MRGLRLPDSLDHIRRAAAGAQQYLEGTELSEFLEDEFVQDAVMMKFIVMGEAATRILNRYPDFAENHPEIPWRQMPWHAQPHGARLFRHRLRDCMSNRSGVPDRRTSGPEPDGAPRMDGP